MNMIPFTHVEGKSKGRIELFALSTCVWCKKTRKLLDDIGVDYYYVYVDLLEQDENLRVKDEMKKWNPLCSFPTLIFGGDTCVVGFDEEKIMKVVG
jgi:glutaredoxin-like protein NrdH